MILWLDAQLPPALAEWMAAEFDIKAAAVRYLQLRDTNDAAIFSAARTANAVVMTKDADFVSLLERLGPPPQVVWLTVGNTSNEALRKLLIKTWPKTIELLNSGEPLVEIGNA